MGGRRNEKKEKKREEEGIQGERKKKKKDKKTNKQTKKKQKKKQKKPSVGFKPVRLFLLVSCLQREGVFGRIGFTFLSSWVTLFAVL